VRTFGIRRNEKIACYVTVRGEKAMNLIVRRAARRPAARGGGLRAKRGRPARAPRSGSQP
jgi:ribosomal protein L5